MELTITTIKYPIELQLIFDKYLYFIIRCNMNSNMVNYCEKLNHVSWLNEWINKNGKSMPMCVFLFLEIDENETKTSTITKTK